MEELNNNEMDETSQKIAKELHDLFHRDATYLLEDQEFVYNMFVALRKRHGLSTDLGTADTIIGKVKSLFKTLVGVNTTKQKQGKKEFDSAEEAFLYLTDKSSEHYKALPRETKLTLSSALYKLNNGGITRDRVIRLLEEAFEVQEKIILQKKISKLCLFRHKILYLLSISNSKSIHYLYR